MIVWSFNSFDFYFLSIFHEWMLNNHFTLKSIPLIRRVVNVWSRTNLFDKKLYTVEFHQVDFLSNRFLALLPCLSSCLSPCPCSTYICACKFREESFKLKDWGNNSFITIHNELSNTYFTHADYKLLWWNKFQFSRITITVFYREPEKLLPLSMTAKEYERFHLVLKSSNFMFSYKTKLVIMV